VNFILVLPQSYEQIFTQHITRSILLDFGTTYIFTYLLTRNAKAAR